MRQRCGNAPGMERYWRPVVLALFLVVTFSSGIYAQGSTLLPSVMTAAVLPADLAESGGAPFVPGEVAVGFYEATVMPASLLSILDAQAIESLDLRGYGGSGQGDVTGYLLRTPVGREWETIAELAQHPAVAFVEPNWIVRAANVDGADANTKLAEIPYVVSDPFYEDNQWYLQRISASRAWALATGAGAAEAGARPVIVSVIDSGVDVAHPELKDRLLEGYNYLSPGQLMSDEFGHGTHVAGLIGAAVNNGAGIAGMVPSVEIDPRKVLDSRGSGRVSTVAQAIRDAVDAGAQIINLSLEVKPYSAVLESAAAYAFDNGALLIAAAGNYDLAIDNEFPPPVRYPAAYETVMAIAATDYYDRRASYGAVGDEVELAAPGGTVAHSIFSTWSKRAVLSCNNGSYQVASGGSYCNAEGTSMSAAIVSGLAALVWGVRPELTADEVRAILHETAFPLNFGREEVGSGRIDAHAAVRRALPGVLAVSPTTIDQQLALGSGIVTRTLAIENPSLEPVTWEITNTGAAEWFWIGGDIQGDVRHGKPARTTVVISATNLMTGTYSSLFWIVGRHADGSELIRPVHINTSIVASVAPTRLFLPTIRGMSGEQISWPLGNAAWEMAGTITPTVHGMIDNSSVGITLPFTFTFKGQPFTDALIHSDGYVGFPAASTGLGPPNRCLQNTLGPQLGLFGWWADLDPSVGAGKVSSFQPAADRFVIEFRDVASAPGISPAYRIDFQIVLHKDGHVGFNYLSIPEEDEFSTKATIGLVAWDGRFQNEVVCRNDQVEVGAMPLSYGSFLFESEDVY